MGEARNMDHMHMVSSVDGTEIGSRVLGNGPPLIMVHGTGVDGRSFRNVENLLARHFTVYLMDRRDRGVSGRTRAEWQLMLEAEDIAALVRSIDEPVRLFAHSFGAGCALEAVPGLDNLVGFLMYDALIPVWPFGPTPEIVGAIVAAGNAGDWEEVVRIQYVDWTKRGTEAFKDQKKDSDRWARRIAIARTLPREFQAHRHYNMEPSRMAEIAVPTRLLSGETTGPYVTKSTKLILDVIPGVERIELKGAGHFLFDKDPERFVGEVLEFFGAEEKADH